MTQRNNPKFCDQCGFAFAPTSKFCGGCGVSIRLGARDGFLSVPSSTPLETSRQHEESSRINASSKPILTKQSKSEFKLVSLTDFEPRFLSNYINEWIKNYNKPLHRKFMHFSWHMMWLFFLLLALIHFGVF